MIRMIVTKQDTLDWFLLLLTWDSGGSWYAAAGSTMTVIGVIFGLELIFSSFTSTALLFLTLMKGLNDSPFDTIHFGQRGLNWLQKCACDITCFATIKINWVGLGLTRAFLLRIQLKRCKMNLRDKPFTKIQSWQFCIFYCKLKILFI